MGTDGAFSVLVSMLQRKVVRLQDLRNRAQTGRFGDGAHQRLAEPQEVSTDVCDLIIVLFAINPGGYREVSDRMPLPPITQ